MCSASATPSTRPRSCIPRPPASAPSGAPATGAGLRGARARAAATTRRPRGRPGSARSADGRQLGEGAQSSHGDHQWTSRSSRSLTSTAAGSTATRSATLRTGARRAGAQSARRASSDTDRPGARRDREELPDRVPVAAPAQLEHGRPTPGVPTGPRVRAARGVSWNVNGAPSRAGRWSTAVTRQLSVVPRSRRPDGDSRGHRRETHRPAAMSVRCWAPSNEISATPSYAAARAAATSAPVPTTASTRPPAVTSVAVPQRGAGVDDVHAVERLGVLDAGDHVTRGRRGRVAAAGHHHATAAPSANTGGGRSARVPVAEAISSSPSGDSSSASSGWVSGSPNRALNSTTRTPARGERQAGVQQPRERRPAAGQLVDGRLQDGARAPPRPGRAAPTAAACRRPCHRCWVPRRRRRSA